MATPAMPTVNAVQTLRTDGAGALVQNSVSTVTGIFSPVDSAAEGVLLQVHSVASADNPVDGAWAMGQMTGTAIQAGGGAVMGGRAAGGVRRPGASRSGAPTSSVRGGAVKTPCNCFVAGTAVATLAGTQSIESIAAGDVVIAAVPEAEEEPWTEVGPLSTPPSGAFAWSAVGRFRRWAQSAGISLSVMSTTPSPGLLPPTAVVQVYEARTSAWHERVGSDVRPGETVLHDGVVYRMSHAGLEPRGWASESELFDAGGSWDADAVHHRPTGTDWVLLLGDDDTAGHWPLRMVAPSERFAFQGRVYETADADGDGLVEIRPTQQVLGRVYKTYQRFSPVGVNLTVSTADGAEMQLTGTPEHPFWVAAADDYVAMGDLGPGTALTVELGSTAVVRGLEQRKGDFEVFNFEVEGAHNYFVSAMGEYDGVLVHNGCGNVDLTGHRSTHILNRHRPGSGKSGKTEFPSGWSDSRILHEVSDVATDPASVTGVGKWNSP